MRRCERASGPGRMYAALAKPGEWQSHSLCMPARRKPRQPPPQRRNTPPGKRSEAPARRSAADRQTQASGSEGRRGGHRHAHDPPRGSSAGRGAHRAAANAKPSPDPTGGAGRGRAKANPPKGGRPCAPPLKPRRRARSAPEHGAGGPTRTARAKPAAEGGGEAGPPERPPVYGGRSILGGRGADYDTPPPPGCSLFIVHRKDNARQNVRSMRTYRTFVRACSGRKKDA